jgi:hypothetical protein
VHHPEDRFTISQVGARTGMSVHALRFYEQAGLLRDDVDRAGGRRWSYCASISSTSPANCATCLAAWTSSSTRSVSMKT